MLNKIIEFSEKYGALINYIVKPLLSLLITLIVGYHLLWLKTHYVSTEDFVKYSQTTNQKLDLLLQNQIIYTEQQKTFNLVIGNVQKDISSLDERVRFIERNKNR